MLRRILWHICTLQGRAPRQISAAWAGGTGGIVTAYVTSICHARLMDALGKSANIWFVSLSSAHLKIHSKQWTECTWVEEPGFDCTKPCCYSLENRGGLGRKGSTAFLLEKEGGFWIRPQSGGDSFIWAPVSSKPRPGLILWAMGWWPSTKSNEGPPSLLSQGDVWVLLGADLKMLEDKADVNIAEGAPCWL